MAKATGGGDEQLLQSVLRRLQEVSTVTGSRTRAVLEEFGLNETSAGILWMLDPDEPPATMRELARRIGCDPSNVTLVSDKLEQAGLTVRQVNPSDARSRMLTLTDAGLDLRARLLERLAAATPVAALSHSEQQQLERILTKLAGR